MDEPVAAAAAVDKIATIALTRPRSREWYAGFSVALALALALSLALIWLLVAGVAIWGINSPVGWGFAIVNFVWWIGIAHAGTLISAILLLLRQPWRTAVSRFAESMTLFALACAALFPLIHLGRPWLAYWLLPYSNTMGAWPQFRSPLVWDIFAILTYAAVSFMFWYIGLMPDLAVLRDRAVGRTARVVYGALALGWRGSARHWKQHEVCYRLLAGLATVLVISVHTVVSFDFAVSVIPGWHSTIFPPYFVAGAIFSGFGLLLVLAIPLRTFYGIEDLITWRHLENMAKILLAASLVVGYAYIMEMLMAWYGGNPFERFMLLNRALGPYSAEFWALLVCNVAAPQLLWSRRLRQNTAVLFAVAAGVCLGMWLERYIIVVTSLHRDYLPAAWGLFTPTRWDWIILAGSAGLFLTLLLLFVRFLPLVPVFENTKPGARGERRDDAAPAQPAGAVGELYGVMAEFETPEKLLAAARRSRDHGYRCLDAYSRFPIESLAETLGGQSRRLSWLALAGGLAGGLIGYGVQFWTSAIVLPVNIGGRPLHSWPAFIPITFECAILGASLAAVVGMFALNRLPAPYHPVFNAPRFGLATSGRYFLCIEAADPLFERRQVEEFLGSLHPREVVEVGC